MTRPMLPFRSHHLRRVHDAASEQLSVAEERVLSETSATSRFAWVRLANELISEVQCEVDGEQVGVGAFLSMLEDPDRGVRKQFMEGCRSSYVSHWNDPRSGDDPDGEPSQR